MAKRMLKTHFFSISSHSKKFFPPTSVFCKLVCSMYVCGFSLNILLLKGGFGERAVSKKSDALFQLIDSIRRFGSGIVLFQWVDVQILQCHWVLYDLSPSQSTEVCTLWFASSCMYQLPWDQWRHTNCVQMGFLYWDQWTSSGGLGNSIYAVSKRDPKK